MSIIAPAGNLQSPQITTTQPVTPAGNLQSPQIATPQPIAPATNAAQPINQNGTYGTVINTAV